MHESIDDAKNRSQVKHIGIGKMSDRLDKIPSVTSAFNRVTPSTSEGCKASPFLKERGHQEVMGWQQSSKTQEVNRLMKW